MKFLRYLTVSAGLLLVTLAMLFGHYDRGGRRLSDSG